MALLVDNIQWVMVVCGLLTCTMFQAVFAPRAAMLAFFGETLEGKASVLVTRNWGALSAAGGVLLIYAAFTPEVRPVALILVGVSKAVFVTLVLMHGKTFLSKRAGTAVIVDSAMVVLFAAYLVATYQMPAS
jgi:hypothetical protein